MNDCRVWVADSFNGLPPTEKSGRAGGIALGLERMADLAVSLDVIGRPPILRRRHQRIDVVGQSIQIETLELLGVIELLAHGIGQSGVLMANLQV